MDENQTMEPLASGISRRRFFGYAGALAGAGLLTGVGAGCKKDDDDGRVNLGGGDLGLLNYAYALEQLEAAFYIELFKMPYIGISPAEQAYLEDIRDHEIAHRDFLKAMLGTFAIQPLTPNFESIDFSSRSVVLGMARMLEDLGVSAYNGVAKYFTQTTEGANYLSLAGKIVSVEARHAAIIREMIQANSFADTSIVDATNRIDMAREPSEVLALAGSFFREGLNGDNLITT